jgi:hypothetical protein
MLCPFFRVRHGVHAYIRFAVLHQVRPASGHRTLHPTPLMHGETEDWNRIPAEIRLRVLGLLQYLWDMGLAGNLTPSVPTTESPNAFPICDCPTGPRLHYDANAICKGQRSESVSATRRVLQTWCNCVTQRGQLRRKRCVALVACRKQMRNAHKCL